jgi:hypothetical protein
MSLLFCKSCGRCVEINSPFCDECGTPTATGLPGTLRRGSLPQMGRVTTFFASQATLCLFTLLTFLGLAVALAPVGWRYASLQLKSNNESNATANDARSLGTNTAPARCNQIVVIFNATATVARVSALLEQLDTTIAFGPNENGAFELAMPATSAAGVAEALNRASDAVVSASLQRRCL